MYRMYLPASSGNVGVGFDSTGICIGIHNIVDFCVIDGPSLQLEQEDATLDIPCDESNLLYQAAAYTAKQFRKSLPPLYIKQYNHIPLASGLGSSAACIVGGIMLANTVLHANLSKAEMLYLSTELEGHPDNAAPVLYGGITISQVEKDTVFTHSVPVGKGLSLCLAISSASLATKESRAVLPKHIPVADAVNNISCMGLLMSALYEQNYPLLKRALADRLHQPYRKKLISGFDEILSAAYGLGAYGVCLSGAGPTIMAFIDSNNSASFTAEFAAALQDVPGTWRAQAAAIDMRGAYIEEV